MYNTPSLQELNSILTSQSFKTVALKDRFTDAPYTVRVQFVRNHTSNNGFHLERSTYHDIVVGRMTVEQVVEKLTSIIKERTSHDNGQ